MAEFQCPELPLTTETRATLITDIGDCLSALQTEHVDTAEMRCALKGMFMLMQNPAPPPSEPPPPLESDPPPP